MLIKKLGLSAGTILLASTLLLTGCSNATPPVDDKTNGATEQQPVGESQDTVAASVFANSFFTAVNNLTEEQLTDWKINYDLALAKATAADEKAFASIEDEVIALNLLSDYVTYGVDASASDIVQGEGVLLQKISEWRTNGYPVVTPDMLILTEPDIAVLDGSLIPQPEPAVEPAPGPVFKAESPAPGETASPDDSVSTKATTTPDQTDPAVVPDTTIEEPVVEPTDPTIMPISIMVPQNAVLVFAYVDGGWKVSVPGMAPLAVIY